MSDKEKELLTMLNTLYSVVIGYQNMPGETLHPMTKATLVNVKVILDRYK